MDEKFPEITDRWRMEGMLMGLSGSCTFSRGGKRMKGKIVDGSVVGRLPDGRAEFRLLVRGESGRLASVLFVGDDVKTF